MDRNLRIIPSGSTFLVRAMSLIWWRMAVENGPQEGRIVVGVQQIQRARAEQALVVVHEIERKIQRSFMAFADHAE